MVCYTKNQVLFCFYSINYTSQPLWIPKYYDQYHFIAPRIPPFQDFFLSEFPIGCSLDFRFCLIANLQFAFQISKSSVTRIFQPTQLTLLVQINNRNTRKKCEICSKLTTETSEQRQ